MKWPRSSLAAGMRIAVIGTGNIGSTLGRRWREAGHDITYGRRNPAGEGPGAAPVATINDAIADAEVVVLAVPGGAVAPVVAAHGAAMAGKTVIDAANRIGEQQVNSRDIIAAGAPDAHYVRAFNTLGWENFAEPVTGADLFFASDGQARDVAEQLIAAVGLRPVFVGDAATAGTVDALLPLWFALVKQHGGNRKLAFRVVE